MLTRVNPASAANASGVGPESRFRSGAAHGFRWRAFGFAAGKETEPRGSSVRDSRQRGVPGFRFRLQKLERVCLGAHQWKVLGSVEAPAIHGAKAEAVLAGWRIWRESAKSGGESGASGWLSAALVRCQHHRTSQGQLAKVGSRS